MIILVIFGQISDLYFLPIFGKKSKKTAVKKWQKFFFIKIPFLENLSCGFFSILSQITKQHHLSGMFSKYICSYLKQKTIFFFASALSKKIKGGRTGHQVGEKRTFWGQTEISGQWGGRGTKKLAGCEIRSHSVPLFKNFKFK